MCVSDSEPCQQSSVRESAPVARRRGWFFPLAAVLIGLAPAIGFELYCRVVGLGLTPTSIQFESVRPLFVLNEQADEYEIASNRLGYFAPESFPRMKSANSKRVFVLGGSTVQGRPYSTSTSLTTWLELALNLADSEDDWDIINCGGVSYASYRLTPILEEVLDYEPDHVIVMTGHNEFLESRELNSVPSSPSRAVNVVSRWFAQDERALSARPILPEEVDALLDYEGGLEAYKHDFERRSQVGKQFEENLRTMVKLCRRSNTPLLFVRPVSDYSSTPPFKASHGPELSEEDKQRWKTACKKAVEAMAAGGELDIAARNLAALKHYQKACAIDPWHAAGWYLQGKHAEAIEDFQLARQCYETALSTDVCPLRMSSAYGRSMAAVGLNLRVEVINANTLFEAQSLTGIVPSRWMLDHVHPTIAGHQLIANTIAAKLMEKRGIKPPEGWSVQRDAAYQAHLESIPRQYFTEGARRLESLTNWARGRGDKLRINAE